MKKAGEAYYEDRHSRFLAHILPVSSEKEALDFIAKNKQEFWDAKHNVFAYIVKENNIMRYSDDREPSGTAGMPVLDVLKKRGLTNVCAVVTRYFGGVLLGTGGLVHAYSKSANDGVLDAGIIEMIPVREIEVFVDYSYLGKVENFLAKQDVFIDDKIYGDGVVIP